MRHHIILRQFSHISNRKSHNSHTILIQNHTIFTRKSHNSIQNQVLNFERVYTRFAFFLIKTRYVRSIAQICARRAAIFLLLVVCGCAFCAFCYFCALIWCFLCFLFKNYAVSHNLTQKSHNFSQKSHILSKNHTKITQFA